MKPDGMLSRRPRRPTAAERPDAGVAGLAVPAAGDEQEVIRIRGSRERA